MNIINQTEQTHKYPLINKQENKWLNKHKPKNTIMEMLQETFQ